MKLKNILQVSLLGISALMLLFPASLYAQDATVTSEDSLAREEFQVELKTKTQSPINGAVPLVFTIKSKLSSKTAFIRWEASENIQFLGKKNISFSLTENKTYTFTQNVKPLKGGTYRITAVVEAWRPEANYLDSEQVNMQFNKNLERLPITEEYSNAKLLWVVGRILIALTTIAVLFVVVKLGYKKFTGWLSKD